MTEPPTGPKNEPGTEPGQPAKASVTYRDAGVDIDAGNALVRAIKPLVAATRRPGADGEIGGFGGLFDLKAAGYSDPILVAANDVYIIDFEGEPDRPVEERRQKAPASRDIATMLRSFDYAARTAVDRQRQRGATHLNEIETRGLNWRSLAERRFLRSNGMARDDSTGGSHLAGGELLPLFLADKLFEEIIYEGTNRPVYLATPLRAALELVAPLDTTTDGDGA